LVSFILPHTILHESHLVQQVAALFVRHSEAAGLRELGVIVESWPFFLPNYSAPITRQQMRRQRHIEIVFDKSSGNWLVFVNIFRDEVIRRDQYAADSHEQNIFVGKDLSLRCKATLA
jgi:hypothetical protein